MDYSKLWHGRGIELTKPVDLQLVRVYERCGGRAGAQGYMMLEGMGMVFSPKPSVTRDSGINQLRFHEGREISHSFLPNKSCEMKLQLNRNIIEIIQSFGFLVHWEKKNETTPPSTSSNCALIIYKSYVLQLLRLPNISEESTRYLEIWKDNRKDSEVWYVDYGIFPQEILHSQWLSVGRGMGDMKECGGCERMSSFRCKFERWTRRQLCYTCARAKSWRRF